MTRRRNKPVYPIEVTVQPSYPLTISPAEAAPTSTGMPARYEWVEATGERMGY